MNEKEGKQMRHFNWWLVGLVILSLAVVLLVGCGVSPSDYDALQADYDELNTKNEAVEMELAEIKEVYPPDDFSSLRDLNDWLLENDVSKKPDTSYADDWYGRALEVQEDALKDGYIVSVDYDYDAEDDSYSVWCTTIINGRIFYWDPETDEVFEDNDLGTVK